MKSRLPRLSWAHDFSVGMEQSGSKHRPGNNLSDGPLSYIPNSPNWERRLHWWMVESPGPSMPTDLRVDIEAQVVPSPANFEMLHWVSEHWRTDSLLYPSSILVFPICMKNKKYIEPEGWDLRLNVGHRLCGLINEPSASQLSGIIDIQEMNCRTPLK